MPSITVKKTQENLALHCLLTLKNYQQVHSAHNKKKTKNSQKYMYYRILRITIGQHLTEAKGIAVLSNVVLLLDSPPCHLQLQTIMKILFLFSVVSD